MLGTCLVQTFSNAPWNKPEISASLARDLGLLKKVIWFCSLISSTEPRLWKQRLTDRGWKLRRCHFQSKCERSSKNQRLLERKALFKKICHPEDLSSYERMRPVLSLLLSSDVVYISMEWRLACKKPARPCKKYSLPVANMFNRTSYNVNFAWRHPLQHNCTSNTINLGRRENKKATFGNSSRTSKRSWIMRCILNRHWNG